MLILVLYQIKVLKTLSIRSIQLYWSTALTSHQTGIAQHLQANIGLVKRDTHFV